MHVSRARAVMTWQFADFELDEDRRALTLRGREVPLQPRVLDVLLYLVRHRDRVVPKGELLDRLWPESVVTESSLQRAVSLARSALRQGGMADAIRSYPRRGYRFCGEPEAEKAGTGSAGADRPALAAARASFEDGDWEEARRGFEKADAEEALPARDLERWAESCLNLGRPSDAVGPLERAVAAGSSAGDPRGAARAAVLLTQVRFEGRRGAVAQGWHARAMRLLEDCGRCRELALAEWMAGRMALGDGNIDAALSHTGRALEIARELGDADVEAVSLLYRGHALISAGKTEQGLALQDEAAAAVIAGEVSPWFAGLVYCGVVYVCQNRGDWMRAAQWTDDFTRWSDRCPVSTFPAVCRLHRAEVLTVRGELEEAERTITETCDELAVSAPWAEGDAHRLLGDVRQARGDREGAEAAYRRAYALGWDPTPGFAHLLLERGEAGEALRALERALEDPGWACRQRRRFLMASTAIVAVAAGEMERAREALAEIDGVEDGELTPPQRGARERARAEVAFAEGRTDEAVRTLRASIRAWEEFGCPLEVAVLRVRLAEILREEGDAGGAELEASAAEEIFRRSGAEGRLEACRDLRRALRGG